MRIFCASQVFDVSCHHSLKTQKLGKKGPCNTFRIYISKIICTPTGLKESTCHPVLLFAWQCHKRFCFFKPPKLNLHSFFLLCARIETTKDLINWNQMPIKSLKIWTNFKFLFNSWQINCCEPSERNCKKVHESLPVISPAESTREQFSTANWLLLFLKQKQKLNFFPLLCTKGQNKFWSCKLSLVNVKNHTFIMQLAWKTVESKFWNSTSPSIYSTDCQSWLQISGRLEKESILECKEDV